MDEVIRKEGEFLSSLKRNNKEIKEDRAAQIFRTARTAYKRKIEDLEDRILELNDEQKSMLDLSPKDTVSLLLASDFKADVFLSRDTAIGIARRETQIELDIVKERFLYLFGGTE